MDTRTSGNPPRTRVAGQAGEFVGTSAALAEVKLRLNQVVDTGVSVLLLGGTGAGKGLAARAQGPFITLDCGAVPAGLVESELYGHEKGAFTGAIERKVGKGEVADGGTLFLDEVGNLPLEQQPKLLRLLVDHAFQRVGGTETLSSDVRVIAATNRDLHRMVE